MKNDILFQKLKEIISKSKGDFEFTAIVCCVGDIKHFVKKAEAYEKIALEADKLMLAPIGENAALRWNLFRAFAEAGLRGCKLEDVKPVASDLTETMFVIKFDNSGEYFQERFFIVESRGDFEGVKIEEADKFSNKITAQKKIRQYHLNAEVVETTVA